MGISFIQITGGSSSPIGCAALALVLSAPISSIESVQLIFDTKGYPTLKVGDLEDSAIVGMISAISAADLPSSSDMNEALRSLLNSLSLSEITNEQLSELDALLLDRVFVMGMKSTPFDWAVFGAIYSKISTMKDSNRSTQYSNLVRWFDFMQHQSRFRESEQFQRHFPVVKINLAEVAMPSADSKGSKSKGNQSDRTTHAKDAKKAKRREEAAKEAAKQRAEIMKLDLRVGRMTNVRNHPSTDEKAATLYVEDIDIGTDATVQVVSGLRPFVPLDEMEERLVVVLLNVEPGELHGVTSSGIVMCASNNEHTQVEVLDPPAGSKVGESIRFDDIPEGKPDDVVKGKKLHKLLKMLSTSSQPNSSGLFSAMCESNTMKTSSGIVTVKSLSSARIK